MTSGYTKKNEVGNIYDLILGAFGPSSHLYPIQVFILSVSRGIPSVSCGILSVYRGIWSVSCGIQFTSSGILYVVSNTMQCSGPSAPRAFLACGMHVILCETYSNF